jgi:hypothetical protein
MGLVLFMPNSVSKSLGILLTLTNHFTGTEINANSSLCNHNIGFLPSSNQTRAAYHTQEKLFIFDSS